MDCKVKGFGGGGEGGTSNAKIISCINTSNYEKKEILPQKKIKSVKNTMRTVPVR
jgi:hypothetical protein